MTGTKLRLELTLKITVFLALSLTARILGEVVALTDWTVGRSGGFN
jgi:hypothetical protein